MTNKILLSLIALSFIGFVLSVLSMPAHGSLKAPIVQPLTEEIEIEFLPDATVAIVDAEISVEYVSDTNPRNVVCGEYTCTFTPQ